MSSNTKQRKPANNDTSTMNAMAESITAYFESKVRIFLFLVVINVFYFLFHYSDKTSPPRKTQMN